MSVCTVVLSSKKISVAFYYDSGLTKDALTDIETAFLQVGPQPTYRDVTKFLWLKDLTKPLTKDNLPILSLKSSRAPFCLEPP